MPRKSKKQIAEEAKALEEQLKLNQTAIEGQEPATPHQNGEQPEPHTPPRGQFEFGLKGNGVEKNSIQEIDNAAEEYVSVRDRRMAFTKEEIKNKAALLKLMKDHKIDRYEYDDKVVEIVPPKPEGIKVHKNKSYEGQEDVDISEAE